jgi:hypothetical protein
MMKQMAALGIDSFTDYGFNAYAVKNSYARFKAGEVCFDYGEIDGLLQDSWAKKRKASPIPYFPIVPTGWDATLRCRFDVPFPWNGDVIYPYCGTFTNNTDAIFEKYLRDAKAFAMSDPEKKGIVYINAWNEYTFALTLISTDVFKPVTVGINVFYGFNFIQWQYLFATSLVATIPVVVLFLLIEKHLVAGLTSGGVKG